MKSITPLRTITRTARLGLSGNWGRAIGLFLLLQFITTGLSLALMSWLFSGPLMVGVCAFFLSAPKGSCRVSMLFDGFNCFGRAFLCAFLIPMYIFFWSLLFIIPGIIKTYSYSMAFFVIADDPSVSAVDAITRSRNLMNGNKMRLFGLYLRFVGWGILSILTLGIGFLWLWPYIMASTAAFYEDIKRRQ